MPKSAELYMPRHVVILAHPRRSSFNGHVADAYCEAVRSCRQEAIVRDLYAMDFDPVLKDHEQPGKTGFLLSKDVEAEHEVIGGSNVFVMVYPIWFGMPPAMMKGYIDRVLGAGVTALDVQHRTAMTLMRGRRLVSITSSGASKSWLNEQNQLESLRNVLGRYLAHAFAMKEYEDLHFGETVEGLEEEYADQYLRDVHERAKSICEAVAADHTEKHHATA